MSNKICKFKRGDLVVLARAKDNSVYLQGLNRVFTVEKVYLLIDQWIVVTKENITNTHFSSCPIHEAFAWRFDPVKSFEEIVDDKFKDMFI